MQRHERRLLNVVEEMALAATIPVPPVYVLEGEAGINAFAAGLNVDDAVLAFSEGAMTLLNREQLQGVAGHEFSHILNGDMRLNVRIVAILNGLLMINKTGRILLDLGLHSGARSRYRRDQKNGAALLFLIAGGAMWALGTAGQFFGAMIKAALSRQREFLADASAVQFTRNPQGIAGALRVIASTAQESKIENPRAHELGHIFFSFAYKSSMFATHPPLKDRIQRLMPSWSGAYLKSSSEQDFLGDQTRGFAEEGAQQNRHQGMPESASGFSGASYSGATTAKLAKDYGVIDYQPSVLSASSAEAQGAAAALDSTAEFERFKAVARKMIGAQAVFLVYFAKHSSMSKDQTLSWLSTNDKNGLTKKFDPSLEATLAGFSSLSMQQSLDVLRIAVAGLKGLDKVDYARFRKLSKELVQADQKRSVSEWVGFELMTHACDHHFGLRKAKRPKYKTLESVQPFFELILSKFIALGTSDDAQCQAALKAASESGGLNGLSLKANAEISTKEFMHAVEQMKYAFPLLKPRLIKALFAAAKADGEYADIEVQLLTVLAAIWDLPLSVLDFGEVN
jgi:Zn-dependent protease with chaperone function